MTIPAGLEWWRETPDGAAWLDRLPRLVAELAERWRLEVGPPYEPANASWVAPATRADGSRAYLKLNFPEWETEHEGDALAHWDGEGAALLLEQDRDRCALLVEAVEPGTQLWAVPDEEEANAIAAAVMRRLWRPPPVGVAFYPLDVEAERWSREIPERWERLGRPFERGLVDAAAAFLRELGPSQRDLVVVNADYHGGNVLRATREPWLMIDPKPLLGEREFFPVSLLRDRRPALARDADPQRRIRRRLDQLTDELGLDRERMRGWAVAHALAWGMDDRRVLELHVACARWLLQA